MKKRIKEEDYRWALLALNSDFGKWNASTSRNIHILEDTRIMEDKVGGLLVARVVKDELLRTVKSFLSKEGLKKKKKIGWFVCSPIPSKFEQGIFFFFFKKFLNTAPSRFHATLGGIWIFNIIFLRKSGI